MMKFPPSLYSQKVKSEHKWSCSYKSRKVHVLHVTHNLRTSRLIQCLFKYSNFLEKKWLISGKKMYNWRRICKQSWLARRSHIFLYLHTLAEKWENWHWKLTSQTFQPPTVVLFQFCINFIVNYIHCLVLLFPSLPWLRHYFLIPLLPAYIHSCCILVYYATEEDHSWWSKRLANQLFHFSASVCR